MIMSVASQQPDASAWLALSYDSTSLGAPGATVVALTAVPYSAIRLREIPSAISLRKFP
jgi:hypothetical protein